MAEIRIKAEIQSNTRLSVAANLLFFLQSGSVTANPQDWPKTKE
jgi:hypothetical protein